MMEMEMGNHLCHHCHLHHLHLRLAETMERETLAACHHHLCRPCHPCYHRRHQAMAMENQAMAMETVKAIPAKATVSGDDGVVQKNGDGVMVSDDGGVEWVDFLLLLLLLHHQT